MGASNTLFLSNHKLTWLINLLNTRQGVSVDKLIVVNKRPCIFVYISSEFFNNRFTVANYRRINVAREFCRLSIRIINCSVQLSTIDTSRYRWNALWIFQTQEQDYHLKLVLCFVSRAPYTLAYKLFFDINHLQACRSREPLCLWR